MCDLVYSLTCVTETVGAYGKVYEIFLIRDEKNPKPYLFFCTRREFRDALCLFVLKYLESLIKLLLLSHVSRILLCATP